MDRHHFLSLICALTLAASTGSAQSSSGIKVKSVVKVLLAKDTAGYSVAYDYDFPQQRAVFIKGVGTVAAKGAFSYLCRDNRLEVRDPDTGSVLLQTELSETVVAAARPPLNEIPSETEFPREFQSFPWDSPKSLPERSNAVLNKYFRYLPREDKGTTYLITTFTPLPLQDAPAGTKARLALLLSFPYEASAAGYTFHVQSLVKEGRDLSDNFRPPTSKNIVPAADTFVRSLIGEMKAGLDVNR